MKTRVKVYKDALGQFTHQLVALRESGRIDFYSNFMLIEDYYEEDYKCIDIETGVVDFLFKFKTKDNKEVVRKCHVTKFGMNFSTIVNDP